MPTRLFKTFVFCLLVIFLSCKQQSVKNNRVIAVQPFDDIDFHQVHFIYNKIKKINPTAVLRSAIPLLKSSYYEPKNRYRADLLIAFLKPMGNADTLVIGMTSMDISTTKGNEQDWGVMGLGYNPGNSCVVSTYRLVKKNLYQDLFKISVHELGHNQGLPHCSKKACYMRDAEGKNVLHEETDFCDECKDYLIKKGWIL